VELLDQGVWVPLDYNSTASIYGTTTSPDNQDVGNYTFVRSDTFYPGTTLPADYFGVWGIHFAGQGAFTLTLRLIEP